MNLIIDFAAKHQQWVYGVVIGWATAHPGTLLRIAFTQAMKIGWVKRQILSHPDDAKKLADTLAAEFKSDVDEAVKENAPSDPSK